MKKIIAPLLLLALFSCSDKKPSKLIDVESEDFTNVTLVVNFQKDSANKVKATTYFTLNGTQLKADDAKIFINGVDMPLDSSRTTEIIKEDGYVVDIKTPDGINDTEMTQDDLKDISIPDTLAMSKKDNGIVIPNLSPIFTVTMISNSQPVKIVSVNDGLLVIDPATLGKADASGNYNVSVEISKEKKSELSNKMRSITRQSMRKNATLKTE